MKTPKSTRDPYQDVIQNTQVQEGDDAETVLRKQLGQAKLEVSQLETENTDLKADE